MTKTASIYAAQILLGVIAMAAGYAKLTGTGLMVQQFQMLGIGQSFLTIAGAAEIVAGLCSAAAARRHPRRGAARRCHGRRTRRDPRQCGERGRAAAAGQFVHRRPASRRTQSGDQAAVIQIVRPRAEWDI